MNDIPQPLPDVPQLRTLLLTDLCDSTELVERLGDTVAAELFREHDTLVLRLQQEWRGRLIDRSDGLLLLFERPIDGLGFALDYQQGLRDLGHARGLRLLARAGLHVGEVLTWRNSEEAVQIGAKPLEVEGLAKPVAARLMTVARPGQILLSAVAESLTQRAARELGERGERLLWKSHGHWRFKGMPTRMEIYEVGEIGLTPLRAPKNSPKAWRDTPLWRRPAALVAEVALIATMAVGGWFFTRSEPAIAFAERDWVVVGDMRNLTGDTLLDDSLQQAFRISLEQSRYVNVVSEDRASRAVAMMRREPGKQKLDRETAADVAERLGVRAVLLPSVADIGGRKRFTVELVDPHSRQTVLVSSAYASGDGVLVAVDNVTHELRDRLGESETSILDNGPPLPEVTTSSLDALRAYALGQQRYARGDNEGALAFYRSAVEMDPHFALAWLAQARANFANLDQKAALEALDKATALQDRLPPREAMYCANWRLQILHPDEATDAWVRMADIYPDFLPASHNAALNLHDANRFKQALPYAEKAAHSRIDLTSVGLDQYGRILLALGDLERADSAFGQAVQLGLKTALLRQSTVAASKGDFKRAHQLLDSLHGDYHEDNIRVSIALDQGDVAYALERAKAGQAASVTKLGADRLNYQIPLAVAYMRSGNPTAGLDVVRQTLASGMEGIEADPPVEATSKAVTILGAAIVAQRMGDQQLAEEALSRLGAIKTLPDVRISRELVAVVKSGLARAKGDPQAAMELLKPYLDDYSRFQTRAAMLEAARAAGRSDLAAAQRSWMASRRGMAYSELDCGYCLQALNVIDADAAAATPVAVAAAAPAALN